MDNYSIDRRTLAGVLTQFGRTQEAHRQIELIESGDMIQYDRLAFNGHLLLHEIGYDLEPSALRVYTVEVDCNIPGLLLQRIPILYEGRTYFVESCSAKKTFREPLQTWKVRGIESLWDGDVMRKEYTLIPVD